MQTVLFQPEHVAVQQNMQHFRDYYLMYLDRNLKSILTALQTGNKLCYSD